MLLKGEFNFKTSPFLGDKFFTVKKHEGGSNFMTQQQQSREVDVSESILDPVVGEKERIKYLTRFQVPREGLFDMVAQEPGT